MNGWQWYSTKTLQVVPYMPGTPVYKDGMLVHLYTETKRLGRIEQTFCGDHFNLDKFVSYFDSLKTLQVLCAVNGETLLPVGYSWVASPKGVDGARSASPGFCFFEDVWHARDLARLAVAYAFIDLKINCLHGVQVVDNLAARNFSRRLGFREVAIVPNYHTVDGQFRDARVMMLTDEEFIPGFHKWKEGQVSLANSP